MDTTSYSFLHFAAQAIRGGQDYTVVLYNATNQPLSTVRLAHYGGDPAAGSWNVYTIPLSALRANATHIKGVAFVSRTRRHGTLYLDSMSLTGGVSAPTPTPTDPAALSSPTPTPTDPAALSAPTPTPTDPAAPSAPTPTPTDPAAPSAPTPTPTDIATPSATPGPTASIKTVFVIVMENHNWSAIQGSPSAPYINNALLPQASYATEYFNPPGNHPSEPNYLWLEAGTNFGVSDDNPPSDNHQSSTAHLVTLLEHAGLSWKAYEEGTGVTTCPLTDSYPYATKHNPMIFFDDVTGTNNPNSAYCIAHERPYTELATDLQNNTVANYNFITPNLCDDMHDSCSPTNNEIQQGDTWLSHEVPKILNSQAYKNGGALFITWDEGENSSDGPIGMIVLSPYAKGHGYSNTIHYTHSSTLRTIQEIFHITPLLGDAAKAADLSDLFVAGTL